MSSNSDAHNNGDCWPSQCQICIDESDREWRCEAHNITTAGDCAKCDDELIALSDEPPTRSGSTGSEATS